MAEMYFANVICWQTYGAHDLKKNWIAWSRCLIESKFVITKTIALSEFSKVRWK